MSGLHDRHQQHRERREERHEERHERHEQGGRFGDDSYGQQQRHRQEDDRPQSYQQGGYGYTPGPPAARGPAGFASQGGLDRGDFASDEDISRLVSSGKFGGKQEGYGGGGERGDAPGRYDAPSGPPPGQGFGRGNERYDTPSGPSPGQGYGGRYDAPSGPPPGRGYQGQQPREDYGPGGGGRQNQYASQQPQGRPQYESQQSQGRPQYESQQPQGRPQYESQQSQGRPQYDSPQAPQSDYGRNQGNAPSGGFGASRDGEDQHRSGYGGPRSDRDETPRRGEADSYYNQQGLSGQGDRYSHPAGTGQDHGDDSEAYRRPTQGLQGRIQAQTQSRRPNDEDDYSAHIDAHRKAYGDDDHGPMDADAIGSAAAMEAFKQTAAAAGNAPAGAFKTSGAGSSSKAGRVAQEEGEEEEETIATRAGGSGGLQDKLMGLAMSQAGKLFDKKNAGASGGNKEQDKAQAMQSASATAMQLFAKYKTNGKLDSGDMSSVMGLAMKML